VFELEKEICVYLSPCQHVIQNPSKAAGRSGSSLSHSTTMENSSLVFKDLSDVNQSASTSTQGGIFTATTTQQEQNPPTMAQGATDGLSLVRKRLRQQNIPPRTCDIIMESWRAGTTKQYRVYLDKWTNFATARNESSIHPTVAKVLDFLTHLYDSGSSYSAISTARSALSAAVDLSDSPYTVGEHPLIKRFIKAAFQSRPPLSRYHTIWDVSKVLDLLKTWSPAKKLNLKLLTLKLVMLCLLVTGQRCQSVHFMDIRHMVKGLKGKSSFKFHIDKLVKQSRPGKPQPVLVLPAYPADKRLCVMSYLQEYLTRTESVRNSEHTSLFLSHSKPHHPVCKSTISRWFKIDTVTFMPHSTRAASASAAFRKGIPLETIMAAAGWSAECTFATYYQKDVKEDTIYGESILSCSH